MNVDNTEIKYVDIVFENCESIRLPIERFTAIYTGGITRNLLYQSHLTLKLPEDLSYSCSYAKFGITFEDESELEYNPQDYDEPLGMFTNNPTSNSVVDRPNILGRISGNDVTHLDFIDADKNSVMYLAVPFDGEWTNELMKTKIDHDWKRVFIEMREASK